MFEEDPRLHKLHWTDRPPPGVLAPQYHLVPPAKLNGVAGNPQAVRDAEEDGRRAYIKLSLLILMLHYNVRRLIHAVASGAITWMQYVQLLEVFRPRLRLVIPALQTLNDIATDDSYDENSEGYPRWKQWTDRSWRRPSTVQEWANAIERYSKPHNAQLEAGVRRNLENGTRPIPDLDLIGTINYLSGGLEAVEPELMRAVRIVSNYAGNLNRIVDMLHVRNMRFPDGLYMVQQMDDALQDILFYAPTAQIYQQRRQQALQDRAAAPAAAAALEAARAAYPAADEEARMIRQARERAEQQLADERRRRQRDDDSDARRRQVEEDNRVSWDVLRFFEEEEDGPMFQ